MAVIILSLLLAVGVWADQLMVETNHDKNGVSENLVNQLPVKTFQEVSASILMADQLLVNTHQDDSEIPNESSSGVLADQLPVKSKEHFTNEDFDKAGTECEYPFEPVGNNCFFFSDEQRNFDGAVNYCNSLDHGYDVTLSMLELDILEDEALLDAAKNKGETFWLGGKTEDGVHWKWQDGRDINLEAPFWYETEPNETDSRCTAAQVTTYDGSHNTVIRSYLYDYDCAESFNFICQIGCPFEFRRIDKYCYFVSEEEGLGPLSWQDARDYCQALSVPAGHHADLAVFGLPDQDAYKVMNNLLGDYHSEPWVGAYAVTDNNYKWIDGRSLLTSSPLWYYNQPYYVSQSSCVYIYYSSEHNRRYLYTYPYQTSITDPFICQMFKDA